MTATILSILAAVILALLFLLAVTIGRGAKYRDTQIPRPITEHDASWWDEHTNTDPRGES